MRDRVHRGRRPPAFWSISGDRVRAWFIHIVSRKSTRARTVRLRDRQSLLDRVTTILPRCAVRSGAHRGFPLRIDDRRASDDGRTFGAPPRLLLVLDARPLRRRARAGSREAQTRYAGAPRSLRASPPRCSTRTSASSRSGERAGGASYTGSRSPRAMAEFPINTAAEPSRPRCSAPPRAADAPVSASNGWPRRNPPMRVEVLTRLARPAASCA